MSLAIAFGKKYKVIGFDISDERIDSLSKGIDKNQEVSSKEITLSNIEFTSLEENISGANIFIVTVPTPVTKSKTPDLGHLLQASEKVGKKLKKEDIVVYESTVYPGVTEDICVPILEKHSSLVFNRDFHVGYSPERLSPGKKENNLENIKKIVSASNSHTLTILKEVYESIIKVGVHIVKDIRTAEMSKVIENAQRDINIAFMNEVAIICDYLNLETHKVLNIAKTKWNFVDFSPGLVGGHCIGVDPYYLAEKSKALGYVPQIILAGRRINDSMGSYIAQKAIKKIMKGKRNKRSHLVTIMGATFKENCSDLRNSLVLDIYKEILLYGFDVQILDTVASFTELSSIYGSSAVQNYKKLRKSFCLILAVKHDIFKGVKIESFLEKGAFIIDVKNFFHKEDLDKKGYDSWRL